MSPKNTGSIIDPKDLKQLWKIFSQNWYIVLFFALASGSVAYIYTYKMLDIYAGRTQILLKSPETYDYQSQMYKTLGYYGAYEDISNQIRVINSYNLIEKTVSKLNLDISYFIVGRLKTTEVYGSMPFNVNIKFLSSFLYEVPINLKITDENHFRITFEKNNEKISKIYPFNEDIEDLDYFMHIDKNGSINSHSIKNLKEIDYQFIVHDKNNLVHKYKSSLSIENIEYTSILQVTLEDGIPERAVTFLDTLSRVYIDYTLHSKIDVNENTISYIDKQLHEVLQIMSDIENDMEMYRNKKDILDLGREESEYFSKLMTYSDQKRELEFHIKSLESLEEYILKSSAKDGKNLLPPAIYMKDGDDFLNKSINEIYTLQLNRNSALFDATEGSSPVKRLDEKLEGLRKDLLQYMNNVKKAIKAKVIDSNEKISFYESLLKKIPKTQRDILNIDRKLQVNEKMYLYLLEKRANTVIARAGIVPETKVIESARSIGRIKPDKQKIIYTYSLGGIVVSLFVVFLRVVFFRKIDNIEELKEITSMPIFGEIILNEETDSEYIVVDSNPRAAITESFRTVRTNLEYLDVEHKCKTILITSHNPNEGKTFCSINLASILAKADKKVLLLELDLHKPKVHVGLNMKSKNGISSILSDKETIENCLIKTEIENLDVILSGPVPPNASELILSKRMQSLFDFSRKNYDYLVIDTPPIGLITDALVLMKYADATLFVLNAQIAKREYIRNAEEIIKSNGIKNFGFLLNGVKYKKSKYYYNYNYSYGYKYGYSKGYGYGANNKN